MAKKFVTEEGLSQVVDAVVDAIKKVSDKQITEEKVTEKIDAKITEIGIGHIEENVSNLERRLEGYVTNEALGGKIEEAIGVANVEPIKEKIKTLNGRVPVAGSETHTEEHTDGTAANAETHTEQPPIMVASTEPI